jgi:hypothetical protein
VLNSLSLQPSNEVFRILVKRYIDNGNSKEVNYVKFCDDVDNVSEMLESVVKGIKQNPVIPNLKADLIEDT